MAGPSQRRFRGRRRCLARSRKEGRWVMRHLWVALIEHCRAEVGVHGILVRQVGDRRKEGIRLRVERLGEQTRILEDSGEHDEATRWRQQVACCLDVLPPHVLRDEAAQSAADGEAVWWTIANRACARACCACQVRAKGWRASGAHGGSITTQRNAPASSAGSSVGLWKSYATKPGSPTPRVSSKSRTRERARSAGSSAKKSDGVDTNAQSSSHECVACKQFSRTTSTSAAMVAALYQY
mmetsp:Transcript_68794/g.188804  ORF Transcript_68794/g.188804 Transcript_68794/m.188804 type:complete len:239 (-) Transcript_68794:148-864(-)